MTLDQTTITTLIGAALPMIAAFVKMTFKMRRDLDRAFAKIRELQR